MMLTVRMILYALFAGLASQGIGVFDPAAETLTLTLQVESVAAVVTGALGFVGTFVSSRIAKAWGGVT